MSIRIAGNTVMGIMEQQKQIFDELRHSNPGIIDDGVSDEEQYTSAKYRIMYVLKEVNGGSGWSLCDHLLSGGRDREHDPTWDNIARWSEGIFSLPLELTWSQLEKGLTTIGWIRNIYPTRKTAEDALNRNDLFVMKDENKVVAAAVINQIQVDEYKYAKWKYLAKDNEIMVLHCLVVDPFQKNKGYGRTFVAFIQRYSGCAAGMS